MSMELLSPAGGKEALIAAIQNGANAVYLGAQMLNARAGAGNFDREALKWAADYAHERGARIHVTVNTMVKESESGPLEEVAEQMAFAGVDVAEDGSTRRWRVENSWGSKIADKGYFTMSDDWFTEYVYEVAVPKALLPAEYQAALDEPAISLPAWDPMGALA